MLAQVHTLTLHGLEAHPVMVEVDVTGGLPFFEIVGLPDASVRESKDRVRAGLRNSGFEFPVRRITVNLAPANIRKVGASFDLPIALGVLAASGQIPINSLSTACFCGELSLDGRLRSAQGAICLATSTPDDASPELLILPTASEAELALVPKARSVRVAENLHQVVAWLRNGPELPEPCSSGQESKLSSDVDLSDVYGQHGARRALEITAAGRHHLLLIGPPGEGKTMLASRLPGILPPVSTQETLQVAQVYSAAGLMHKMPVGYRPVRAPHHTISLSRMIGGGNPPVPGEVTLAHNGILFLDELAEFRNEVLTSLRQLMETGTVTLGRGTATFFYPAGFQLIAATNPCPCGWLGDERRKCSCSDGNRTRYQRKLSGPLLDRFDLFAAVHPVQLETDQSDKYLPGEPSAQVRKRVRQAWQLQIDRAKAQNAQDMWANGCLPATFIREACGLDATGTALLDAAARQLALSTRGRDRVLRVARTIADLAGKETVTSTDLAEAVSYRQWF